MLGSALYFPYIDINDPAWLRSALLFWDDIQTISPSRISNPYRNEDTKICFEEGVLRPLHCDLHPNVINELGKKVIETSIRNKDLERSLGRIKHLIPKSLKMQKEISLEIEDNLFEKGLHTDKVAPETAYYAIRYGLHRLHRSKMPYLLERELRKINAYRFHKEKLPVELQRIIKGKSYNDEDGDWLLVESEFASAYMSALASRLCNELDLSPLTSEKTSHGLNFRHLFGDIIDASPQSAPAALMTVTMRGISVDSTTPIEKIIRFKRNRKDQYIELKSQITELSQTLSNSDETFIAKAQHIYDSKIEKGLRQIKRELDHNFISSAWEGAFTATTVSASSTSALAYFSQLTGPALLGAGMAIAAGTIGVRSYLNGRKLRINNPYSYLHDVKANFGLPDFSF